MINENYNKAKRKLNSDLERYQIIIDYFDNSGNSDRIFANREYLFNLWKFATKKSDKFPNPTFKAEFNDLSLKLINLIHSDIPTRNYFYESVKEVQN